MVKNPTALTDLDMLAIWNVTGALVASGRFGKNVGKQGQGDAEQVSGQPSLDEGLAAFKYAFKLYTAVRSKSRTDGFTVFETKDGATVEYHQLAEGAGVDERSSSPRLHAFISKPGFYAKDD